MFTRVFLAIAVTGALLTNRATAQMYPYGYNPYQQQYARAYAARVEAERERQLEIARERQLEIARERQLEIARERQLEIARERQREREEEIRREQAEAARQEQIRREQAEAARQEQIRREQAETARQEQIRREQAEVARQEQIREQEALQRQQLEAQQRREAEARQRELEARNVAPVEPVPLIVPAPVLAPAPTLIPLPGQPQQQDPNVLIIQQEQAQEALTGQQAQALASTPGGAAAINERVQTIISQLVDYSGKQFTVVPAQTGHWGLSNPNGIIMFDLSSTVQDINVTAFRLAHEWGHEAIPTSDEDAADRYAGEFLCSAGYDVEPVKAELRRYPGIAGDPHSPGATRAEIVQSGCDSVSE